MAPYYTPIATFVEVAPIFYLYGSRVNLLISDRRNNFSSQPRPMLFLVLYCYASTVASNLRIFSLSMPINSLGLLSFHCAIEYR